MTRSTAVSEDLRAPEQGRLYRLGNWTARNPLKVMTVWLVLLVGAGFSASYFASHLTGVANVVTGSDSQQASRLIDKEFPGSPSETDFVVLRSQRMTVQDPTFRHLVTTVVGRYDDNPLVAGTANPYAAPQQLISPDRHTALIPVRLDGSDKELQDAAGPLQDLARGLRTDQIEVYFTGSSPLAAAGADQGAKDLARAESIGFPAAAIVLLIAFGSLVAAAIPLVVGALAVLAALGVLGVVAMFTPFDVFVQTAVSMVGVALGIDYSLFIVTRYREELARTRGDTREERAKAVGRTVATAGHAVLFSGSTVVLSLAGLWLARSPKVHSMAMGMTVAALVMMLVSVTLLPAILGLLGTRINRFALWWAKKSLSHPDPEHSVWAKVTSTVMRRPTIIATGAMLLLGALALPVFGLRYGVDLGATAVADSWAGKGYAVVSGGFEPGVLTPIDVVVSRHDGTLTDAQLAAISRFAAKEATNGEVTGVTSVAGTLDERFHGHTANDLRLARQVAGGALGGIVSEDGGTSVITVRPRHGADTKETAHLVRVLREDARETLGGAGLEAHAGGEPAEIVDITDESSRAMPIVIGAVLVASWLLFLLVFRSLLLPFKAVLMNLFTSGAAFGTAVLIFQEGHGAGFFHVDRTGFIQVILPLFAFALVFGLSMDYEVFMLSRIREEWEGTGDSRRAVQVGITRTARVITAAATIMVVIFASFMFTRNLEIKQMGFMLGLAVLIDATIVRLLLVPALMRLMGHWAWWLPRWMGRILPRISPGGQSTTRP